MDKQAGRQTSRHLWSASNVQTSADFRTAGIAKDQGYKRTAATAVASNTYFSTAGTVSG